MNPLPWIAVLTASPLLLLAWQAPRSVWRAGASDSTAWVELGVALLAWAAMGLVALATQTSLSRR